MDSLTWGAKKTQQQQLNCAESMLKEIIKNL